MSKFAEFYEHHYGFSMPEIGAMNPAPNGMEWGVTIALATAAYVEALTPTKTLRDEFAMAALTGIIAAQEPVTCNTRPEKRCADAARSAYAIADAMLEARKEKS